MAKKLITDRGTPCAAAWLCLQTVTRRRQSQPRRYSVDNLRILALPRDRNHPASPGVRTRRRQEAIHGARRFQANVHGPCTATMTPSSLTW